MITQRLLFALVITLLLPPPLLLASPSAQEVRRIEEIKRQSIAIPKEPLREIPSPDPQAIRTAYLTRLSQQKIARQADILNILVILFQMDSERLPLSEQIDWFLKNTGLTREDLQSLERDQPISRGRAALWLLHALKINSGFFRSLFPKSERYAYRDAVYHGFLTRAMPAQYLSGPDLIYMLQAATQYLLTRYDS